MSAAPGALRRAKGALALAFAIALAAGVLVTAGATLLARARVVAEPPGAGRFFVVARGPLAEATRAALAAQPDLAIVAEHSIDQLLGETMALRTGSETLRVLEVTVPRRPDADLAEPVATLQQLEGVVEVIDLEPGRAPVRPSRAPRQAIVGGGLLTLGCALFVLGLILSATMAVRASGDEIAVCYLLGAEPSSLWRPLGMVLGVTALAGVLGAVVATSLGMSLLLVNEGTASVPIPTGLSSATRLGLILGASAFVVGAVATAALAARHALLRITMAPARLLALLVASVMLAATLASARDDAPSDWQVLRGVGREVAACRRGLLDAERTLAETELGALRAYAKQDAVLIRLADVQREEDVRMVEHWRESCAALEMRRAELRLAHRASVSPGPPIVPREPPVTGGLAVAFGEGGRPGKPHAFRNGVGLRVRPGEVVRATAAGKVVYSGDLAGAGRVVVISHGRRTFSVYGRVGEALVVRGMQVEAGEPVASAEGDRAVIYFSVRERGKAVDPVDWLRADPSRAADG